jgi:hypothetical protein
MNILGLIFTLIILGVIGYLVQRYSAVIEPTIKKLIIFVVVVVAILLVIWFFMALFGVSFPSLTTPIQHR